MLAITCRSTYALERFGSSSGGSASSPTSSVPGGVLDCVPPPPPPPHAAASDKANANNRTAPTRIPFIVPLDFPGYPDFADHLSLRLKLAARRPGVNYYSVCVGHGPKPRDRPPIRHRSEGQRSNA